MQTSSFNTAFHRYLAARQGARCVWLQHSGIVRPNCLPPSYRIKHILHAHPQYVRPKLTPPPHGKYTHDRSSVALLEPITCLALVHVRRTMTTPRWCMQTWLLIFVKSQISTQGVLRTSALVRASYTSLYRASPEQSTDEMAEETLTCFALVDLSKVVCWRFASHLPSTPCVKGKRQSRQGPRSNGRYD